MSFALARLNSIGLTMFRAIANPAIFRKEYGCQMKGDTLWLIER